MSAAGKLEGCIRDEGHGQLVGRQLMLALQWRGRYSFPLDLALVSISRSPWNTDDGLMKKVLNSTSAINNDLLGGSDN